LTNNKPPNFAHMAYWNSRVWGSPTTDPTGVYFSGDAGQIPFGVAEECYPSSNALRIPAEDGRVCGMSLFDNLLVITTDRYSYYVVGSNETNYMLQRFATTMFGVGDYQMVELAGETANESSTLIYLGNDYRVYAYSLSSGNVQISQPIQDQLTAWSGITPNFSLPATLTQIVASQARWIVVAMYGAMYIYDYENKLWTRFTLAHSAGIPLPFGIQYGPYVLPAYGYSGVDNPANPVTISVYQWALFGTVPLTSQRGYIRTAPLDFDRKSLKRLNFVRMYVSGLTNAQLISTPWGVSVSVDDGLSTVTGNFTVEPDLTRSILPVGSGIDSATANELIWFPTTPLEGHRFQVTALMPAQTAITPVDAYAIDVCASDVTDPAGAEP
jgi:hypothetical protein